MSAFFLRAVPPFLVGHIQMLIVTAPQLQILLRSFTAECALNRIIRCITAFLLRSNYAALTYIRCPGDRAKIRYERWSVREMHSQGGGIKFQC